VSWRDLQPPPTPLDKKKGDTQEEEDEEEGKGEGEGDYVGWKRVLALHEMPRFRAGELSKHASSNAPLHRHCSTL